MAKYLKGAARLPILGPIITAGIKAFEVSGLIAEHKAGNISLEDMQQQAGRATIGGIGNIVGNIAGDVLGVAVTGLLAAGSFGTGAIAGPVIIGLTSVAGDLLGGFIANIITDYILSPKYTKAIGAFVTNTTPPKEELQDYIMQNGTITPFSTKDQVLGMKTGGAIDNLLSDFTKKSTNTGSMIKNIFNSIDEKSLQTLSVSTAKYNEFAKSALTKQINQQEQVIDLLIQLIKKPSGGSTTVQHMSQPNSTFASSNFRDTFKQQTLVV